MKKLTFFLSFLCVASLTQAQQADEKAAIRAVIDQLFHAMRANDSTLAAPLFHESAVLKSIGGDKGMAKMHASTYQGFVTAIGTPHEGVWDEHIGNVQIMVDGNFAIAWMDFTFYLNDQKLHCGVNMFQFVATADGWKIIGITDTRRKGECPDL